MSDRFSITSSTGTYEVFICSGSLPAVLNQDANTLIIADEFFRPLLQGCSRPPILIRATEAVKSLDEMPGLVKQLRHHGANRSTQLLALGGGVIQDLTAFLASIYMRGVRWRYVPTTLLAMVDSCIGGKSSINVGPFKNLVGTFHPPLSISIDPELCMTLPTEQVAAGLVEAAKICFCRGSESFARYLSFGPGPSLKSDALHGLIAESLRAKKYFIEIDEFDKKERLLLNFGHTFGHAIEGASTYGISHGIAVGLGILCALTFQRQRGLSFAPGAGVNELEDHLRILTHESPGLTQRLKALNASEIWERFDSDKKHTSGGFTLVLIAPDGRVRLEMLPRTPEVQSNLRRAIQTTIESYTG